MLVSPGRRTLSQATVPRHAAPLGIDGSDVTSRPLRTAQERGFLRAVVGGHRGDRDRLLLRGSSDARTRAGAPDFGQAFTAGQADTHLMARIECRTAAIRPRGDRTASA